MQSTPILQVQGFSKNFELHEQGKSIPSSSNVSLEVFSGKLTALTGPTGAGKSSVLKGIYRTYLASAGKLIYTTRAGNNVDLATAAEHTILALRRHEIAFVTQFLHFLPRQSSEDVVAQPLLLQGEQQTQARQRARELLAAMALPERLWTLSPATFSGGEKQRVNLARGLISRPRLLLLDEPTASLDPNTCQRVVELINNLKHQNVAMLAIFHQPDLVEQLADFVVEIKPPISAQPHQESSVL